MAGFFSGVSLQLPSNQNTIAAFVILLATLVFKYLKH
jgi:hypothetical protein